MKKSDLVKLKNDNYKSHNLTKDMRGIVIETNYDNTDVLFFNPHNVGNYAVVNIKNEDLESEKEKLPTELEKELSSESDALKSRAKDVLAPIAINEYDMVELLVEEERYARQKQYEPWSDGVFLTNTALRSRVIRAVLTRSCALS